MKKSILKSLAATALCLTMVIGLAVPAFAAADVRDVPLSESESKPQPIPLDPPAAPVWGCSFEDLFPGEIDDPNNEEEPVTPDYPDYVVATFGEDDLPDPYALKLVDAGYNADEDTLYFDFVLSDAGKLEVLYNCFFPANYLLEEFTTLEASGVLKTMNAEHAAHLMESLRKLYANRGEDYLEDRTDLELFYIAKTEVRSEKYQAFMKAVDPLMGYSVMGKGDYDAEGFTETYGKAGVEKIYAGLKDACQYYWPSTVEWCENFGLTVVVPAQTMLDNLWFNTAALN